METMHAFCLQEFFCCLESGGKDWFSDVEHQTEFSVQQPLPFGLQQSVWSFLHTLVFRGSGRLQAREATQLACPLVGGACPLCWVLQGSWEDGHIHI